MKKYANLVFLGLFLLCIFALPLCSLLLPGQSTSFYEQRALAAPPALSKAGLWRGDYFTEMETAISDHVAFRDSLLKGYTALQLGLGRPVVNEQILQPSLLLPFFGFVRWDLSGLQAQSDALVASYEPFHRLVQSYGGYFCYVGLPQQSSYFANAYPGYQDSRLWHTEEIRRAFTQSMAQHNIPFLDMYEAFKTVAFPDDYYFQSDHHYTYEGVFFTYTSLITKIKEDSGLDFPLYTLDDLHWETLPNPFLGSSNRKLYGLYPTTDTLAVAYPKTPIAFTRQDNGYPVPADLFALPTTQDEPVTYSIYMGGDQAETIIETQRPHLPKLLIIGDSFTNPLETMLWMSFDETRSLDFRHYNEKSLVDYVTDYRPDVLICVRDESLFLSGDSNGQLSAP